MRAVAIAAVVVGFLGVLAIGWLAGETQYRACIEKQDALYPVEMKTVSRGPDRNGLALHPETVDHTSVTNLDARSAAVDRCSWP